MDRKKEFRKALKRTSRYILSHHRPQEYYRCYRLKISGKTVGICARCLGIYAGILLAIVSNESYRLSVVLIGLSGMPTFIEKYLTGAGEREGFNSVRTVTGALLGFGFVHGVIKLLETPLNLLLWSIAGLYNVLALALILLEHEGS